MNRLVIIGTVRIAGSLKSGSVVPMGAAARGCFIEFLFDRKGSGLLQNSYKKRDRPTRTGAAYLFFVAAKKYNGANTVQIVYLKSKKLACSS